MYWYFPTRTRQNRSIHGRHLQCPRVTGSACELSNDGQDGPDASVSRRRHDVTRTDDQADGPPATSDERGSTRADDAGSDGLDAVDADTERVSVTVRHVGGETVVEARPGRTLRDVLLEHGLSPYTRLTDRVNCGGRGLCATCGVRLRAGPAPEHWHDRLADRFGYPRLSCQIEVREGMIVELDEEKVVWGARESE